jgi:ribosome biogenesis GTPase A
MTSINWYPGHMAKATRELKEQLKQIHLVIEVLDARIPYSSQNPHLEKVIAHKPRLIILNKKDLADVYKTQAWMTYFNQQSTRHAIAVNAFKKTDIKAIISYCETQLLRKSDASSGRQSFQRLNVMIVGIPNVGKSQLINQLANKKSAKVANRPAVTQHQQWVRLSPTVYLLDTPGVLWPKFESEQVGINLAVTGAIKDHIFNMEDVSFYLLRYLTKNYPTLLQRRFKLTSLPEDIVELMMCIGRQRGCIERGGTVDLDKTVKMLLHEYRSGKLGLITLEDC